MWRAGALLRLGDISFSQHAARCDNQYSRLQHSTSKGNLEARGTAAGIPTHAEAGQAPVNATTLNLSCLTYAVPYNRSCETSLFVPITLLVAMPSSA